MSTDLTQTSTVSKPVIKIKPKTDNALVYKTVEERRIIKDISKISGEYDLVTVLATSNYQYKINQMFGNTSWENASWNKQLLYPNVKVDVEHLGKETLSGSIVAIEFHISSNIKIKQPGWKYNRPMGYVIMTLLLPKGSLAQKKAVSVFKKDRVIPVSISALSIGEGKRKLIAITICKYPRNQHCFAICGRIEDTYYNDIYPLSSHKVFNIYRNDKRPLGSLPKEIYDCALNQYNSVLAYKATDTIANVIRDVSPIIYNEGIAKKVTGVTGYNMYSRTISRTITNVKRTEKTKLIGTMWKALSIKEKQKYNDMAKLYNEGRTAN